VQMATLPGHSSWVLGVAASPDGTCLASCSADRSVRVWDVGSRRLLQTLTDAHSDQVWGVAFDPSSSSRMLSVGDDKAIKVYEVRGDAPDQS
jgi:WD40 repeat protein